MIDCLLQREKKEKVSLHLYAQVFTDLGAVIFRSEALRFGASVAMTKVRPKAGTGAVTFPKPVFCGWFFFFFFFLLLGFFFFLVVVFSFSIPLKISMFFAEIAQGSCAPVGGASTSFTMNFSYKPGYAVLRAQRNGHLGVERAA